MKYLILYFCSFVVLLFDIKFVTSQTTGESTTGMGTQGMTSTNENRISEIGG